MLLNCGLMYQCHFSSTVTFFVIFSKLCYLILSNVVVDYGRTIHWIWSLLFNSNIVLLVYIFDNVLRSVMFCHNGKCYQMYCAC